MKTWLLCAALCLSAHAEPYEVPDSVGIFQDKPGYERVEVRWGKETHSIIIKGRITEPANEKIVSDWIIKLSEKR